MIGQISVDFGRDMADITDRQNVQLHWIRIEDVPEIWRRLEAVGLHTTEACGDCPRVILGSPVAGIAADEIIDPTPAIRAIADTYIGDPRTRTCRASSRRPSPVIRCTTWRRRSTTSPSSGSCIPSYGPGYDLWVGGGLSTNPMLAVRLGAWVPEDEVAEVWAGVVGLFRDYGYRRLRTRARIKFLVADWGAEKFRDVLETEYLHRPLLDGPAPAIPEQPGDHVGVQPAEGRPVLRRPGRGGRAGQRQPAGRAGRPGRGARVGPAADHADAEDPGAGRPGRPGGLAGAPAPRRWACRPGRTPGGAR